MTDAYTSAIAALAGSAIGGLASFATTWLTQHAQDRTQRFAQAMALRQRLYGEFIEEASRLFTDALTHQLDDPSTFVRLYALVGKLRLFATANVISMAEQVMRLIVETYKLPNRDFAIRKKGRSPTSMCFGHLAKLAVKSYMFSCEAIGKGPPKDSSLSGAREKTEVNLCIGNGKPIPQAVLDWRASK